jgi:hypothetical protein
MKPLLRQKIKAMKRLTWCIIEHRDRMKLPKLWPLSGEMRTQLDPGVTQNKSWSGWDGVGWGA